MSNKHMTESNTHGEFAGHVLLVEDHQDIAEMVYDYFEDRGYELDYAADGITGLHLAVTNSYDAIVLDLMLPGIDGLDVCKRLRTEAKCDTPILMLTARDTLQDLVTGLESGADDYLKKPFDVRELDARLRALVRRRQGQLSPELLNVGPLSLDTGTMQVKREGKLLNVTPIGLKILTVLMRASPSVVARRELERQVWGDVLPDSDTLRSHVYNLRKAVDRPFNDSMILTVPGTGYRLADPEHS